MKQLLLLFLLFCLSANAQEQFTVYFDYNSDVLNKASMKELTDWAENNRFAAIISIEGYADARGANDYNQDLSERRAMRVYEMLKGLKMRLQSVEEKGYGETKVTGTHAKDRKVVINYHGGLIKETVETELSQKFKNAKVGDIISLKNVNFRGGTTYILKESRPALKELLNVMLANPKLKIDIQGHICCDIDDVGDLSGKRADEVFLYLTNNGIDKNRVITRGYGGHRPIHKIPELNNEEMAQNRRVEIEIISN